MKKIILTGFEPFANYQFNPTEVSTLDFHGKVFGDRTVIGVVLPCTYFSAFSKLYKVIEKEKPYAIISTGLYSSVRGMRIETTFRNRMCGKYPDNIGFEPKNVYIAENSPYNMTATARNLELEKILRENNIPTELSLDADAFICNSLGYLTTHAILHKNLSTKNMFVHIPWTTDYKGKVEIENGKIYLEKDRYYKGLELLIKHI